MNEVRSDFGSKPLRGGVYLFMETEESEAADDMNKTDAPAVLNPQE